MKNFKNLNYLQDTNKKSLFIYARDIVFVLTIGILNSGFIKLTESEFQSLQETPFFGELIKDGCSESVYDICILRLIKTEFSPVVEFNLILSREAWLSSKVIIDLQAEDALLRIDLKSSNLIHASIKEPSFNISPEYIDDALTVVEGW